MTGARGSLRDGSQQEEHDLCSKMAPALKAHLEGYGFRADIIDFPEEGNAQDLRLTVAAINKGGYDCSVSLHCDASDNADAKGAHVCYVSAKGAQLAGEIAGRLCPLMPGRANRTVRRTDLYVLNNTKPVAVLVETGFITNEGDCRCLVESADGLMLAVARGIKAYLDDVG